MIEFKGLMIFRNNLKKLFEKEYRRRKKEFKKRYDYYLKIKKGLKNLNKR